MYTPTKDEVRATLKTFSDHGDAFERTLERWGMTRDQFDDLAAQYGLIMTVEDWEEELRMRQQRDQEGHAMYTPTKDEVRAALKMHEKAFVRTLEQWGMTKQAFDNLAERYELIMTVEDWEEEQRMRQQRDQERIA